MPIKFGFHVRTINKPQFVVIIISPRLRSFNNREFLPKHFFPPDGISISSNASKILKRF